MTIGSLPAGTRVVKKIDSLLRGNLDAEFTELSRVGTIVMAPTSPMLGRAVLQGRVSVDGVPLERTQAWIRERRAHGRTAPRSVAGAIPSLVTARLDLETLRSDVAVVRDALHDMADRAEVVIVDAVTHEDLDRLAAAVSGSPGRRFVVAGSAALVGSVGRLTSPPQADARTAATARHRGVAVVVGTPDPASREQVEVLRRTGLCFTRFAPGRSLAAPAPREDWLVTVEPGSLSISPHELTSDLGAAVSAVVGDRDLVLTGGETAASVLDALGLHTFTRPMPVLDGLDRPIPGLVCVLASDGRRIITKPGSYGHSRALLSALQHLRSTTR
jgi:4-hydroxythreonine-4-phosphate dehydrogenase